MKFNKIIPSILCAAIICTTFTACSPGKKPKIRSAEFSLTAEAETANVELNGDYAKIDFINPGLIPPIFPCRFFHWQSKRRSQE